MRRPATASRRAERYEKGMTVLLPRVRLVEKAMVARDTMAFYFEKPDGFEFKAGQYADYTLLDPPETDEQGDTREFTISSAPFEEHLACTVRLRDTAFKRVLERLPLGSAVEIDAPLGSFVLSHRQTRPVVFLVGGVGITPVRSIMLQADHDKTEREIVLFYSNKTPADAAYLDELIQLDATNPNITVVPTMTRIHGAGTDWCGRIGRIDSALLAKHVPDLTAPVYYLCGPPDMVQGMRAVLADAGVDDEGIRTEEFFGY